MNLDVVPFEEKHLAMIAPTLQPRQHGMLSFFSLPGYADSLLDHGEAYTMLVDGDVIACAGVQEAWTGRGVAWALLSTKAGAHMRALTRVVAHYLNHLAVLRRIEAYVDPEFKAAIRWAKLLGFEMEGRMRAFGFDGSDNLMFARVKEA